jgi:hypothetical protein
MKDNRWDFSCCNAILKKQFLLGVKNNSKQIRGVRRKLMGGPKIEHSFFITEQHHFCCSLVASLHGYTTIYIFDS